MKDIINIFKNGEERYNTDPYFRAVCNQIAQNGGDATQFLDSAMKARFDLQEALTAEIKIKDNLPSRLELILPSDAFITTHVNALDTPEGFEQYQHDTAFVKGAIYMRDELLKMFNK